MGLIKFWHDRSVFTLGGVGYMFGLKHGVSKSVGKQTLPNRVMSGQTACLTGWQSLGLSTV